MKFESSKDYSKAKPLYEAEVSNEEWLRGILDHLNIKNGTWNDVFKAGITAEQKEEIREKIRRSKQDLDPV